MASQSITPNPEPSQTMDDRGLFSDYSDTPPKSPSINGSVLEQNKYLDTNTSETLLMLNLFKDFYAEMGTKYPNITTRALNTAALIKQGYFGYSDNVPTLRRCNPI